jgi:hypothetical protein
MMPVARKEVVWEYFTAYSIIDMSDGFQRSERADDETEPPLHG